MDVAAARLGSPLDSVLEVLDAEGREIETATVRCVLETPLTLFDRDSKSRGLRFTSFEGFRSEDYVMLGNEIARIDFLPEQPDADVTMKGYQGERFAYFNTSPQVHALNTPIYKVQILEPGTELPPNGLPVFRLTARNDDGGPGYGPDSHLDFVAPAEGEYVIRLRDTLGREGKQFRYRLTVRHPRPDFVVDAAPMNPNVPRGGRVPVQVTANRSLGYEGPIEIQVRGLPPGVRATPATIPAGQDAVTIILEAAADAALEQMTATPFEIAGRAIIEGREVVRVANPEERLRVVSVMPPPDVVVAAEPREIVLEPGEHTTVTLRVERRNGFQGRVPCNVANLPPGVKVDNIGLNGVLVAEDQNTRTFVLRADKHAPAVEQPFYVVGVVESNSPTSHASTPLLLRVRAREVAASVAP
jgi:hypothetical protein